MKKISTLLPVLLLVTASLFVSCSDDDKDSGNNSAITGTWTKVKEEARTGSQAWEDITESCDLDDVEEYENNGTWTLYPGTVTCGSAAVITGTWELRANNTKVVYTYDGYAGEYESTVETLTSGQMVLTYSAGDLDNTQYRTTFIKN